MALELNGTTGVSLVQDGVVVAADLNSALSDTIGKVKAWVNFNGTGTVAIRASYNVSTITDNGTGDYTVNFTTAMVDTNYSGVALPNDGTAGANIVVSCENQSLTKSTSQYHVWTAYAGASSKGLYDVNTVNVAIFR